MTNGTVRAAAVHDQTLYIGGTFTRVAPAANLLGPLFGVSATTGAPLPRMPLADDAVLAIEPDGAGGYYVGGRFTRIGGVARTALAHVLADGTVDPAFVPALTGIFGVFQPFGLPTLDVRSLARVGGTLYLGGSFAAGSGTPARTGLAALDAATGAPRPWNPPTAGLMAERILIDAGRLIVLGQSLYGPPTAIAVDPATGAIAWTRGLGSGTVLDGARAGTRLIVGGSFMLMDASNIRLLASLDPDTGTIDTAWAPHRFVGFDPTSPTVHAVTVVGSTVYVGGSFTALGEEVRTNLAAVDIALGTVTEWAPAVNGTVRDLAPGAGGSVIVAGAFRRAGGLARDGLAQIDPAGSVTAWAPQAYSTDVRTLHVEGARLLAGCTSAVAGGVARDNLAAFALNANDVLPFAPALTEDVVELGIDGARVFAGVNRVVSGPPLPAPAVIAFEADTGAPSSWTAPDFTNRLLGVFDGHVYVFTAVAYRWMLMRLDAVSGAIDPSWRFDATPSRVLFDRDRVYFLGNTLTLNGEFRQQLAAVDRRTGALSPWNPLGLFPSFPEGSPIVNAAAVMGRTVYAHYSWSGSDIDGVVAADSESGLPVRPTVLAGLRVLDLAVADGLLFGVGLPRTATGAAVGAGRPDGTPANWNPGVTLTATDYPWNAQPRVLASPTDIVVVGVQRPDGTPVHGVAVYARQPAQAPSSLDASVLDNAVRLSWTSPAELTASYVVEAGSASGASDIVVQDTGSGVPALDALAPAGTYFVRVKAAGTTPDTAAAAPTNEIALRVGCIAPPPPPTRFAATVSGVSVTLTWQGSAFASVTRYLIEAGSSAGRTNLARLAVPGEQTTFATDAPPGTYFVRVRAQNACGASNPSTEVWLTVGGGSLPAAPASVTVSGMAVTYAVQWASVPGATAYVLEAGSSPGLADVAQVVVNGTNLGPATVAYGRSYYVRVRAVNDVGIGPPSAEYVLIPR